MNSNPILSLCLPTNGIIEWVFPVLDSIYNQGIDNRLFEVIVTDNGGNTEFQKKMIVYANGHSNLIYKKTDAYMFYNQLEALKLAHGEYLKFVNHRAAFVNGALQKMIDIIKSCEIEKPIIYFSNGVLKKDYNLNSFDEYVAHLKRNVSWTTGVGIWKIDYDNLPEDIKIDKISPHSCILFSERKRNNYRIENFKFCEEIEKSSKKKGSYNLFKAFAVEEPTITQNLYIDGDISASTLKTVLADYKKMCKELYFDFCILNKPCSYDLSGFDDNMGIYFSKVEVVLGAYVVGLKRLVKKIVRK